MNHRTAYHYRRELVRDPRGTIGERLMTALWWVATELVESFDHDEELERDLRIASAHMWSR